MAGTINRIIRSLPLLLGSFERRAVALYGLTPEDAKVIRRHLAKQHRLSHVRALQAAFAPSALGTAMVAPALVGLVVLLKALGAPPGLGWPWLIAGGIGSSFVMLQFVLYTHARFVLIDRWMRRCIAESQCPACDYQLCGQTPTEGGYVRCPECGVVVPSADWLALQADVSSMEATRRPGGGG
jgi:hypothetical protein